MDSVSTLASTNIPTERGRMVAIPAELSSVRRDVKTLACDYRADIKASLLDGIFDVIDAAIARNGSTDLRRGILTAVYNYDTESFEIRWDIAK